MILLGDLEKLWLMLTNYVVIETYLYLYENDSSLCESTSVHAFLILDV